jgi:hypothetical protein
METLQADILQQDFDLSFEHHSGCWFVNLILNKGKGPRLNLYQSFDQQAAKDHYDFMVADRQKATH